LHIASYNGYIDVVKILLAFGADVNDKKNVSIMYNKIRYDMICCIMTDIVIILIRMDIQHCILLARMIKTKLLRYCWHLELM